MRQISQQNYPYRIFFPLNWGKPNFLAENIEALTNFCLAIGSHVVFMIDIKIII